MGQPILLTCSMKYIFASLLLLVSFYTFSQKEDHQWIFNFSSVDSCDNFSVQGDQCGASILDFSSLPPIGYRKEKITLDMGECHASICDKEGNLMLYSNGQSIHGPQHRPVINGDTINFSPKWSWLLWQNENDEWKPTGFRSDQSVGFIPQPETDTILSLYHNYENHVVGEPGTGYLELWMSQLVPNSQGEYRIVSKDSVINDKIFKFGTITACRHGNGRDWWMLQFSRDTVYHYLIDPLGINLDHISTLPFEVRGTLGQSKFSPQGDKFALYGSVDLITTDLMIADFDRCSGDLINPIFSFQPGENAILSNGLEFSPNGSLLYIANNITIYQFDLSTNDIFSSRQTVATYNGTTCGDSANFPLWFGQLQLGPDNKIYNGRDLQCFDIHVINNPNTLGVECDVQQNAIKLPTYTYGTIPNFNTYRLGPLDGSDCDTLSINNEVVSRYWYEQDSIDFMSVQFWDVSYFRPESWEWDLGDGTTSIDMHPLHSYSEKGIYEVCLTVRNENSNNTSCQTLNLGITSTTDNDIEIDFSIFPNPTCLLYTSPSPRDRG